MGFLDNLLGGSSQTTDPSTLFQPQAQFLENQFLPQLSQLFSQGAQVSPTEMMGRQGALQAAGGVQSGLIDPAQQAIQKLFAGTSPEMIQQAVSGATAPLFEQFQNVVAPEIRRSSGAAGQPGGSRGTIATRLAADDLFRQAGDIGSQISLQAHQQGLQGLQGGLSQIPQIAATSFLPSDVQRQIGSQESNQQINFLDQIRQLMGQPIVLGGGGQQQTTKGLEDLFSFSF